MKGKAEKRYGALVSTRSQFLERARDNAALTRPYIAREEGDDGNTPHTIPWSSSGAELTNNLTNKISLSLFPAGVTWVRLKAKNDVLQPLEDSLDESEFGEIKVEIDEALSGIEKEFVDVIEEDGDRVVLHDAVDHLVISGNYALGHAEEGQIRGIPLNRYVTRRDVMGNLVEFCIKDPMEWSTLPTDVKEAAIKAGNPNPDEMNSVESSTGGKESVIDVYTYGKLSNGVFDVYTEVMGIEVEGSAATYNKEALPYHFLRFRVLEDEDYGRSYVEDYIGDLQSIEGMNQMLQEGGAALARFLLLVRPGSVTSKQQLMESRNGAVITGNVDDVGALRADKAGDLNFVLSLMDQISTRLDRAFLMNTAVQRSGDRVTAEEIRFVAQQLEDQLGTSYSNQVVSFQAPYARIKLKNAQRKGRVSKTPDNAIKASVITGAAALGRMAEIQLLDNLLLGGAQVMSQLPPNTIKPHVYMQKRAASLGVDSSGIVLTEEEQQAIVEQQQQAQLAQSVAPEAVRQSGQIIQNQQQSDLAQENQ